MGYRVHGNVGKASFQMWGLSKAFTLQPDPELISALQTAESYRIIIAASTTCMFDGSDYGKMSFHLHRLWFHSFKYVQDCCVLSD